MQRIVDECGHVSFAVDDDARSIQKTIASAQPSTSIKSFCGAGELSFGSGQMPRYFFHIRDGDRLIKDDEGADLPDLAAARKEAVVSAREILEEEMSSAEPWDHVLVEICDDHGHLETVQLAAVFFDDSTRH